jgi:hypothetical protein
MRLRIGALMKIQAQVDMSNGMRANERLDAEGQQGGWARSCKRAFMKGYEMRELRTGERILDWRSVCNLEGEGGCAWRPERKCGSHFAGRVVVIWPRRCSGYTMIHAHRLRPETDGTNVASCSNGGLYKWRGSRFRGFTVYRLMYIEGTVT